MLQDYHYYTFTPEKPELAISFSTEKRLTINKFVSNNDLNFVTAQSLAFQVQVGDIKYSERSFASFITHYKKVSRCLL